MFCFQHCFSHSERQTSSLIKNSLGIRDCFAIAGSFVIAVQLHDLAIAQAPSPLRSYGGWSAVAPADARSNTESTTDLKTSDTRGMPQLAAATAAESEQFPVQQAFFQTANAAQSGHLGDIAIPTYGQGTSLTGELPRGPALPASSSLTSGPTLPELPQQYLDGQAQGNYAQPAMPSSSRGQTAQNGNGLSRGLSDSTYPTAGKRNGSLGDEQPAVLPAPYAPNYDRSLPQNNSPSQADFSRGINSQPGNQQQYPGNAPRTIPANTVSTQVSPNGYAGNAVENNGLRPQQDIATGLPFVTPAPRTGRYPTMPYAPVWQTSFTQVRTIPAQTVATQLPNPAPQGGSTLPSTLGTNPNLANPNLANPNLANTGNVAAQNLLPQYRQVPIYPTAYQQCAPNYPGAGDVPGTYVPPTYTPNLTPGLYTPNNSGYSPLFSLGQENYNVLLGRGIIGQPTVYVPGQPVRNFMRYIFP